MESRGGGAIYVAGLVRRPRKSYALTHPSNPASSEGLIIMRSTTGYAAMGPVLGVSLARAG